MDSIVDDSDDAEESEEDEEKGKERKKELPDTLIESDEEVKEEKVRLLEEAE